MFSCLKALAMPELVARFPGTVSFRSNAFFNELLYKSVQHTGLELAHAWFKDNVYENYRCTTLPMVKKKDCVKCVYNISAFISVKFSRGRKTDLPKIENNHNQSSIETISVHHVLLLLK